MPPRATSTQHEIQMALWFEAAIGGDNRAYRNLLSEISQLLRRYFLKRGVQNQDVDDIVQEVLVSVHKARRTYDTSRPFLPWLFAIAQFRFADFWRNRYTKSPPSIDIDSLSEILAEDVTKTDLLPEGMDEAIAALPEKKRQILHLLHNEGFTAKEAAARLGMSETALKVAAHRIYQQLRNEFGAERHDDTTH